MLNLLIREDRHEIRREYILRFVLATLFFVGSLLVISGAILFSFHVQIGEESKIVQNELESIKNSSDIKNLNELVSLNENINNKISQFNILNFNQSDILEEILAENIDGINLNLINTSLSYRDEGVFALIEIRGISTTRNDLVSYQESLLESVVFESVKIPFSSFAQNSNIPFVVNIETVELNNYFENEN